MTEVRPNKYDDQPNSMIAMSDRPRFYTLVLALLLFGSNIPAQERKLAAADFFPLRVNDSWTYRNIGDETKFTLKVVSEERQKDGSIRYLMEMLAGVKVHRFFSKPKGWVLLHFEQYPEHEGLEAKYEPPKQYLQNPLVPGFKWKWNIRCGGNRIIYSNQSVRGFGGLQWCAERSSSCR